MSKKKTDLLVAEDWAGLLSLRCAQCRFAALQDRQIVQHLTQRHGISSEAADQAVAALRGPVTPEPDATEVAAVEQEARADSDG